VHLKMRCHSPTSIEDTPVIILLEGHLGVALGEELLGQDRTPLPGPGHPVGVNLQTRGRS